jgi:hypothetical protein
MNAEEYRGKVEKALEALMIMEKRDGDGDIAISPKGMPYPRWVLARDLAIAFRILHHDSDEKDIFGAASFFIGLQENVSVLEEVFPSGPKEALEIVKSLFPKLKGKGFGPILKETANFIATK